MSRKKTTRTSLGPGCFLQFLSLLSRFNPFDRQWFRYGKTRITTFSTQPKVPTDDGLKTVCTVPVTGKHISLRVGIFYRLKVVFNFSVTIILKTENHDKDKCESFQFLFRMQPNTTWDGVV